MAVFALVALWWWLCYFECMLRYSCSVVDPSLAL